MITMVTTVERMKKKTSEIKNSNDKLTKRKKSQMTHLIPFVECFSTLARSLSPSVPMFDLIFLSANQITLIGFSIKSENQRHKKTIWLYPKYLSLDQKSETFEPYSSMTHLNAVPSFRCWHFMETCSSHHSLWSLSLSLASTPLFQMFFFTAP